MSFINKQVINGSTLLGVSIALFGLSQLFKATDWRYWVMILSFGVYLIFALIAFFSKSTE